MLSEHPVPRYEAVFGSSPSPPKLASEPLARLSQKRVRGNSQSVPHRRTVGSVRTLSAKSWDREANSQ